MPDPIRLAVIGAGYWGKTLIRVFSSLADVRLAALCDKDPAREAWCRTNYPLIPFGTDPGAIFRDPAIDAVVIATPLASHYALAKDALLAKKHILLEKPMTTTSAEAEELVGLAERFGLCLLVDHTFIFSDQIRLIKKIIDSGDLGTLRYFSSERINLGLIRPDTNVINDLAIHDLSILNYLVGEDPRLVLATAGTFTTKGSTNAEDIAFISLTYPSGFLAHIHVSWISPVKIRKILLGGSKKMIVCDDIEPTEKIRIYDTGVDVDLANETPFTPVYRQGDILIPRLEMREALMVEALEFVQGIRRERQVVSGGREGLRAVRLLESINRSAAQGGERIQLSS